MKRILFFTIALMMLISCASKRVNVQSEPAVIAEAIITGTEDAGAWMTPDMAGTKPFRVLKPGEKIKVIKQLPSAVLIEMNDGARAWIKPEFIK